MKRSKRKIVVLSLLVCLMALITTMGSLAWFSDSKNVTNEFLVAGSDDENPDKVFSVTLWEKTPEGDEDFNGHEYKDILPGSVLVKEPHIKNTGAYDQYIRVTVTISDGEAWINALGASADVTAVFDGFDVTKWNHIWNNLNGATSIPEEIVYVMYYNEKLTPGSEIVLFNNVVIPTTLTQAQAAAFDGGFTINVKAEAVQTENVGADAVASTDAAWTAFNYVASH